MPRRGRLSEASTATTTRFRMSGRRWWAIFWTSTFGLELRHTPCGASWVHRTPRRRRLGGSGGATTRATTRSTASRSKFSSVGVCWSRRSKVRPNFRTEYPQGTFPNAGPVEQATGYARSMRKIATRRASRASVNNPAAQRMSIFRTAGTGDRSRLPSSFATSVTQCWRSSGLVARARRTTPATPHRHDRKRNAPATARMAEIISTGSVVSIAHSGDIPEHLPQARASGGSCPSAVRLGLRLFVLLGHAEDEELAEILWHGPIGQEVFEQPLGRGPYWQRVPRGLLPWLIPFASREENRIRKPEHHDHDRRSSRAPLRSQRQR